VDVDSTIRTRRAVIGAALGTAAAVTVGSLALPTGVAAHDPDDVQLGTENTTTAPTSVENTDATVGAVSLAGAHAGAGVGVSGASAEGVGVLGAVGDGSDLGDFSGTGVVGYADAVTGVIGTAGLSDGFIGALGSGMIGVYGSADSIGVIGDGLDVGVYGAAYPGGIGVLGLVGEEPATMPVDVGVYASASEPSATALLVNGKVKFSRGGRVAMSGSATTLTITMAGVTPYSYVLATLQTSVSGVYIRAVVPATGSFKIYLSKAAGKTVKVGYLVVN
jgi:hypothetical protein